MVVLSNASERLRGAALVGCAITAVLPLPASAEGAIKLLDCTITRVCDAVGECRPGEDRVSFRMEPDALGSGGAGRYSLSYGDITSAMQALSDSGPFLWNRSGERNALLASSETDWLWHQLTLAPAPASTIRFLRCEFQQ